MAIDVRASHVIIGLAAAAVALLVLGLALGGAAYVQMEERRIAALPPPTLNHSELFIAIAGKLGIGIDPSTSEQHTVAFGVDGACSLTIANERFDGRWSPGAPHGTVHCSWFLPSAPRLRRELVFRAQTEGAGRIVLVEAARGMVLHVVKQPVTTTAAALPPRTTFSAPPTAHRTFSSASASAPAPAPISFVIQTPDSE